MQQEDSVVEYANDSLFDSMLVDSSSKLIQNGFTRSQNSNFPISIYSFFCVVVRFTNEKEGVMCEDCGLLSNEKKGVWWRMKVFLCC